jgi:Rrf2 family cysteine metabolism transcriptional repressor
MRISTRGRYGLRAMLDMAIHNGDGPMALRQIAERQGVSESYLEQVFASLRKAGLISAIRGAQGGYQLSLPADKISVGDVLRVLEGPIVPVQCVSNDDQCCGREEHCVTRPFWQGLGRLINDYLDANTLQDLANKVKDDGSSDQMYFI